MSSLFVKQSKIKLTKYLFINIFKTVNLYKFLMNIQSLLWIIETEQKPKEKNVPDEIS